MIFIFKLYFGDIKQFIWLEIFV